MLTLIALSALLIQTPPPHPAQDESHTRLVMVGEDGPSAFDRDGDGQVSREEFAAPMNDRFGRLDRDGDGRLSADEMQAGRHGEGVRTFTLRSDGDGPGPERFEVRRLAGPGDHEVVVLADGDRDPGMRRFEIGAPGHGRDVRILRERVDASGDVRILREGRRREDLDDMRVEVRRLHEADGDSDLDADSDGRLSEAEFTAPLREAFARLDADRSGFVEDGERDGDGAVRVFTRRIEPGSGRED